MRRCDVAKILFLAHELSTLKDEAHQLGNNPQPISDKSKRICLSVVTRVHEVCEDLELETTGTVAKRLIKSYGPSGDPITSAHVAQGILVLENALTAELESVVFVRIRRANRGKFETQTPLFGMDVHNAFPSAAYDIGEIGKCLAFERSTAAVFHCMKPMEVALGALAKYTNATLPKILQWGWVEQAIKDSYSQSKVTDPFVAESLTLFSGVRTAWRNEVMHVAGKYTGSEAEVIFTTVKFFMQHLASKLHE